MTPMQEAEEVKVALNGGKAGSATVLALQTLLGFETSAASANAKKITTSSTARAKEASNRTARPGAPRHQRPQEASKTEDPPSPLSPREKYALATETVNTGLRLLTEAAKSYSMPSLPAQDEAPSTPRPTSRRVLQPRSPNITPRQASPEKSKGGKAGDAAEASNERDGQVTAVAECIRMAFAFLRSADTQKLGVRQMPRLQLETGMLALVGKFIALNLHGMAVKELRHVKRRLEAMFGTKKEAKNAKSTSRAVGAAAEKETLASLLNLEVDFEEDQEALGLAFTHCMHVLKIIASAGKPAVVGEAAQYCVVERTNSPAGLLRQQASLNGQTSKAAKQLEALSHVISSLCPSASKSSDAIALDRARSPLPELVLQLQTIALQIRRAWWDMAKHKADVERDLLEPALRCAMAFVRRSDSMIDGKSAYSILKKSVAFLGTLPHANETGGSASYHINSLLSHQAESAGDFNDALRWAEASLDDCKQLEESHSRKLSALVRYITLVLKTETPTKRSRHHGMAEIVQGLQLKLTGSVVDFDNLLSALHAFSAAATSPNRLSESHYAECQKAIFLAAGFALRYARSYPERGTTQAQSIITHALGWSDSTDQLLSWITKDAAKLFIRSGVLQGVATAAQRRPIAEVWKTTPEAISLHRVCRGLLLSQLRSATGADSVFDDTTLAAEERAALLEMQLDAALQLCSKSKYHSRLRVILGHLSSNLSNLYASDVYPIRRSRVATAIMRLGELHPDLIPATTVAEWQQTPSPITEELGSDAGLESYLEDIKAALHVSKTFLGGRPSFIQLEPALVAWTKVCETCGDAKQLQSRLDDPLDTAQYLRSMASYFSMRGDQQHHALVLSLLHRLDTLLDGSVGSSNSPASVGLAECYLDLGLLEHAERTSAHYTGSSEATLPSIQHHLIQADLHLANDNAESCARSLNECQKLREKLSSEKIPSEQRRAFELLHAKAWLSCSRYSMARGSSRDALLQAKRAVKIVNSIWAALERAQGSGTKLNSPNAVKGIDSTEEAVDSVTEGVSKLQLTLKKAEAKSASGKSTKGAAFWPLVPSLVKALTHLADVYCHHGLFKEATYYSECAVGIAESVGSEILLSRTRSHRAHLLVLAGRVEEAELCLTQDEMVQLAEPSMAAVERLCALATVRAKEGSLQESLEKLDAAQRMVGEMSSERFVAQLVGSQSPDTEGREASAAILKTSVPRSDTQRTARAPAKRATPSTRGGRGPAKRVQRALSTQPGAADSKQPVAFAKVKADLILRTLPLKLKLGQDISGDLKQLVALALKGPYATRLRVVEHLDLMAKANAELESDVTLNVLVESTLSLPSFARPPASVALVDDAGVRPRSAAKSRKPATKTKSAAQNQVTVALDAARDCLMRSRTTDARSASTSQIHLESALLANTSMLLHAVSDQHPAATTSPADLAFVIDQPKMHALQCEKQTMKVDAVLSSFSEPLHWPDVNELCPEQATTAAQYQAEYIDIIPRTWTAVSLCLNDDGSELYLVRYRQAQEPLILRLPFSRHKPDNDADEEAFDYERGKAELQEIIELSNYTCHSSRNTDAKAAKDTWWSDREALDRRMHELVINMENIWLGGFKTIFAQGKQDGQQLLRFRKAFEDILGRYLPSRRNAKDRQGRLTLDDKVLELFIGLGDDQDGVTDLDEPIADLLYFVVDLLQFSGERNAYDEIDFDSMAVDVLDALRSYHDGVGVQICGDDGHLVLVLDRRLQAFPWENMPCLQELSVSRVGSMQSLRDCITAMKYSSLTHAGNASENGEGCYVVPRTSGTYILNPSSDLKATQTMLAPALQGLRTESGQAWASIVNEAPDEQRFSTVLQESSVLLYFGHGAGSQYIRPRAIKRLDSCSEVVWLMGCSSGAVTEHGDLEPSAVPHAYLLAGASGEDAEREKPGGRKCMSVLATLWDVTDKDIDRFSLAVGEGWGLWPAGEQAKLPSKTPKKRVARQVAAPATPQQVPKTPKTPKARKTPAAKTPARARSWGESGGRAGKKSSLVEAVAKGREACYLRYLNGAAAVVYGVPVYLGE